MYFESVINGILREKKKPKVEPNLFLVTIFDKYTLIFFTIKYKFLSNWQ